MELAGLSLRGMGSGLAQGTAEMLQLRPLWEQEYSNGITGLQFADWVKHPDTMKRYPNAFKMLPR